MNKPHTRSKHFNIALVALAIVTAGAVAWWAFDARAGVGHGWHGGGWQGGHGIARLCAADHDAAIAAVLAYGEHRLDITDGQAEEWTALGASLRTATAKAEAVCAEVGDGPATAPEALALAETATIAMAEAIGEVRPAFDALYGVLDDEQRAELDGMIAQHRRAN